VETIKQWNSRKGVYRIKSRGGAKFTGSAKMPPQELLEGGGKILTVNLKQLIFGYQA